MGFRAFLESYESGAFLNTSFSGIDNNFFGIGTDSSGNAAFTLPSPTLDIPTRTIQSRIRQIRYTDNPICICLEDGTEWKLNKDQWDYLTSLGKEPREGLMLQMELFLDGTIKSVDLREGGTPQQGGLAYASASRRSG